MARGKLRRQALTEAELRYGSERDLLTSLIGSLKAEQRGSVRQARRGARMLEASARTAIPVMQRTYGAAEGAAMANDARVKSALDALGPAANGFKSAAAFEAGGSSRLTAEAASAINELVGRATGAQAQGVQEVRAIRESGRADRAKVLDQLQSNVRQSGLFAASRLGDLKGEAADRKIKQGNAAETKRHNKASEQNQRATRRKAARDKEAARVGKVREKSQKLVMRVQSVADLYKTYSQMKDDQGKTPSSSQVRARLISEGYESREIDVANDLIRNNGTLSPRGMRAAHEIGIRVPKRWRPGPVTINRPKNAAGANGQKRPT